MWHVVVESQLTAIAAQWICASYRQCSLSSLIAIPSQVSISLICFTHLSLDPTHTPPRPLHFPIPHFIENQSDNHFEQSTTYLSGLMHAKKTIIFQITWLDWVSTITSWLLSSTFRVTVNNFAIFWEFLCRKVSSVFLFSFPGIPDKWWPIHIKSSLWEVRFIAL